MFFHDISFIPVIIASIVSMALGFVWYSPYLFGKQWLNEMGNRADQINDTNQSKSKMARIYTIALVTTLVSAYVLAVIFNSVFARGLTDILMVGFILWLGFTVPILLNNVLYGGDSIKLFGINAGYQLVSMTSMSLIIGIFS